MANNHRPLTIPTRISSRRAPLNDQQSPPPPPPPPQQQQQSTQNNDPRFYDARSKAHKILGTSPFGFHSSSNSNNKGPVKESRFTLTRRSASTGSRSRKKASIALFPTIYEDPKSASASIASTTSNSNASGSRGSRSSFPRLRARPSSPLLGQEYRAHHDNDAATSTSLADNSQQNKQHAHSPSTVTLDAIAMEPANSQKKQTPSNPTSPKPAKDPEKSKIGPLKIDLSLLFPKPHFHEPALLSPHRLTRSPSPLSELSDHAPAVKSTNSKGKPFSQSSPPNEISTQSQKKHINDSLVLPEPPIWKDSDHSHAATSPSQNEARLMQARYSAQQQRTPHLTSPVYKTPPRDGPCRIQQSKSLRHVGPTRESPGTPMRPQSQGGIALFRKPRVQYGSQRPLPTEERIKRSGKEVMKTLDKYEMSALFLSSDDENSEPEQCTPTPSKQSRAHSHHPETDVVPTYYEHWKPDASSTKPVTRRRTADSVQRHNHREAPRQKHTFSSTTRSPPPRDYKDRLSPSGSGNTTGGISSTGEPPLKNQYQQPLFYPMPSRSNRRSRVIAVTREEEELLEAMRQMREKKTIQVASPSSRLHHGAAHDARSNRVAEDEREDPQLTVSIPSQEPVFAGDISFLRLDSPPLLGTTHANKDNTTNHYLPSSDVEQKTALSDGEGSGSRRFSLAHSESGPPSSASTASPKTPVLPISLGSPMTSPSQQQQHKQVMASGGYYPPPANKPPQEPLPALPLTRRQREKSREDDELIGLGFDSGTEDRLSSVANDESPSWAYGWCNIIR